MSPWQHRDDLAALAAAEAPDQAAITALQARLGRPRRRRRGPAVALALAAGMVLVLALQVEPRPLDRQLLAEAEPAHEALGREVSITYEGRGSVVGVPRDLEITWDEGTLRTAVEPGRGVVLRVVTPEATVTVVGTRFTVDRDSVGTHVAVERGRVELACWKEQPVVLTGALGHTCFRSAAAALQQARVTEEPEPALRAVERGLALDAAGPVAIELGLRRVELLEALDRRAEAREAAEALLAAGAAHREVELRSAAARLAWQAGDCGEALPHLRQLVGTAVGPTPLVLLGDCLAASSPDQARAAWEQALAVASGQDRARIQARLDQQGDQRGQVATPGGWEVPP